MMTRLRQTPKPAVWVAAFLLGTAVAAGAAAQPTVNGWFYGDGDNALYQPYSTSENGSVLYAYFDAPNSRLYVALVDDRTNVNDMTCSPQNNSDYTKSAGWPNHRNCKRASDSEFASFTLACAPGSANNWSWQQALACSQTAGPPQSNWISNATCGNSSGTWPPGIVSSSSWVMNVNTYQSAAPATRAWNLYAPGNALDDWKSPFLSSSPDNATLVPGFGSGFSSTNGSGLFYQWEWSMIYEWSVDLGAGGANCGNQPIFFISGVSHHSPAKNGDENDSFPPPPGDPVFSDFGDLPNSYATTTASGGARHYVKVSGPRLGTDVQSELNGVPTGDATGDGSEEDGVSAVIDGNWTAGSTQSFEIEVSNAPSGALLAGWFDWNGDGDVTDPGEYFTWNVTNGTNVLDVTVGAGFDWSSEVLYARFRIFSSGAVAPGGSLTQADYLGTATDGEVEDYVFEAGTLPVTLNAVSSERAGGELTVRWQTASETDNVGFEVWGQVRGEWQRLSELVGSRGMTSGLPQSYEVHIAAPEGLTAIELRDFDTHGRQERFGAFAVGTSHGELQPVEEIDWSGPRARRDERLRERGFADTGRRAGRATATLGTAPGSAPAAQWKKLRQDAPAAGAAARRDASSIVVAASKGGKGNGKGNAPGSPTTSAGIEMVSGPQTHVAVTEAGIQRLTYEALRDGGLDLAGVKAKDVAVTWRGEPVTRWIDGPERLGPGSAVEFLARPPQGDDALYVAANLYQVSVDRSLAAEPARIGTGKAKSVSPAYLREAGSDLPLLYRHQSPTGDPWVERSVLVRPGAGSTLTLDLPVAGPVAPGTSRLAIGLGTLSDLPDRRDAAGDPLPEHNVEVWFRGPGGVFAPAATSSTSGQTGWTIEAELPDGAVAAGVNQVQLRFSTAYAFSVVVVDDYALRHPSPYLGPSLDFAADPAADGYRIEGFTSPSVAAYAEHADGTLTRLTPRVAAAGGGWAAELRGMDAEHFWVTAAPHRPQVFTTEAPPDLLSGAADLVVVAGSSFVGTPALDDYVAQRAGLHPLVVDVEDVYNAFGYGMALPSAITDFLAARDAVSPFSHVQIVGADCYDRLNHISSCIGFVPLPTAPVGANRFTPSQNRLADLDGDGVADKALAQFSVRDESELATVVAKAEAWESSGVAGMGSALLVAEEGDGLHDFLGQVERLRNRMGWSGSEVLDLADHPQIQTAREAMHASLAEGRTLTVFSGHSSPTVWSFRGLLTTGTVAALSNDGRPSLMVPLACETTYDVSPSANVLGHQLLFANDAGALAISGAAALSSLEENERMANHVLDGLKAGATLGEAVLAGRRALGAVYQELQDNWLTQGDVAVGLRP
jgi:hypothetical protein